MRKINRAKYATVTKTAEGCTVTTNGNEITLESSPKATVTKIGEANREWLDVATRSVAAYEVLA